MYKSLFALLMLCVLGSPVAAARGSVAPTPERIDPASPMLSLFPTHPGWPVPVVGDASPPVCADVDPSYPGLEIVVGSFSNDSVDLYVFHEDGTWGYAIELLGDVYASPAIADLNGDGLPEIVVGTLFGRKVYALRSDGTPLPGWPISVGGSVASTAALADLDPNYPGLEVIVGAEDGTLNAWHADGTPVPGWPVHAGTFVERCSPAVGDVNGDGFLEVFVGSFFEGTGSTGGVYGFDHTGATLPGWPKLTSTHISVVASPALADLDGDGTLEIIVGTDEPVGKMYVWHYDGTDMSGWPYTIPHGSSSTSEITASAAVGDIDGDGQLEIVDGTYGQCGAVYVWRRNGTVMSGWPFLTNGVIEASPVLGDLDGDGRVEIVVGSGSQNTPIGCSEGQPWEAYVLKPDGTVMPGWPVNLGIGDYTPPYPAIADIDGDARPEVIFAFNDHVYAWDAPGTWNPALTPWPYYHLGVDHTGWFGSRNPASASGTCPAPGVRLAAWPNPAAAGSRIRIAGRGPVSIYDAGGRIIRSLIGEEWDGRDETGRAVSSGIYFLRGGDDLARVVLVR